MILNNDEREYIRLEYKDAEKDSKNPIGAVRNCAFKRMKMLESIFGKEMFTEEKSNDTE